MGLEENVYPPVLNFPKPASSTHAKGWGLKGLTFNPNKKQGIYEMPTRRAKYKKGKAGYL